MRRISTPRRNKIMGASYFVLITHYFGVIISQRMRWKGNVSHIQGINAYSILVRDLSGKTPFRKCIHVWGYV
jgi:hypothetical protein